ILLYHNNAKYTPNNLNRIIPELQKQGYKFVTVGELIYKEDAYVDKDGVQHRK
ncbi:MAG: deacetylase, partial [Clostridium paraputrificum]